VSIVTAGGANAKWSSVVALAEVTVLRLNPVEFAGGLVYEIGGKSEAA